MSKVQVLHSLKVNIFSRRRKAASERTRGRRIITVNSKLYSLLINSYGFYHKLEILNHGNKIIRGNIDCGCCIAMNDGSININGATNSAQDVLGI